MISSLFFCVSAEAGYLPISNGYLLFSTLSRILGSSETGKNLHSKDDGPFLTLSSLMPANFWKTYRFTYQGGNFTFDKGASFAFRISFMDAKSLEDFSSQATGAILTMGGASFRVLGASAIDENEMSQCLDMKKQDLTQPFHGVSIDFLLPTGFKSNNRQVIFPTPELFFGSLAIRWLKLTQNGEPYDPVAFGMVMVENYSLSSAAVRLKNNQVFRGCVGNVRYSFNALPDESRSFLSRLASLAPFCGVGYKVSQGMGLVKIRFLAG